MSTATALLTESANYREVLELRLCDAVPSLIELRVTSWYAAAKDPKAPHVKFQSFVPLGALVGLKNAVDAALAHSRAAEHRTGDATCG